MKRIKGTRGLAALIVSTVALVALVAGSASANVGPVTVTPNAITKTFSFVGSSNSKTLTLINNLNGFTINARCNGAGQPVIFAFSRASNGDIFGHLFDGLGRLHIIHNTSFNASKNKGVSLSTSSGDFDASGSVMFEATNGQGGNPKVVTVNYAFDNSTTLVGLNRCTVFGSLVAT
jgi:hypothetical protein